MINKKILLAALLICSSSAHALGPRILTPVDGIYEPMTTNNFNSGGGIFSAVSAGRELQKSIYVCAGNGSAKTPGKLINGNCYYANNGDEHKNTSYYMLSSANFFGGYKWVRADTLSAGARAITTRDWDAGNYLYHCQYMETPLESRVGKYLPGTGKCYWGYFGDEKNSTDASRFNILVPNN